MMAPGTFLTLATWSLIRLSSRAATVRCPWERGGGLDDYSRVAAKLRVHSALLSVVSCVTALQEWKFGGFSFLFIFLDKVILHRAV